MREYEIITQGSATVDCYLGSISLALENQGLYINEEVLFSLADGYILKGRTDEHGFPELHFNVDELLNKLKKSLNLTFQIYDTSLLQSPIEVAKVCRHYGGIIVWVSSKYLPYMQDKYSKLEYKHALLLKDVVDNVAIVYDSFVVNKKPVSYIVHLPLENLYSGALIVQRAPFSQSVPVLMCVDGTSGIEVTQDEFLKSLCRSADVYIGVNSAGIKNIRNHYQKCFHYIKKCAARSDKILDLMAYDITTDHVVPSRKLLFKAVMEAGLLRPKNLGLSTFISHWLSLALTIRKQKLSGNLNLDQLQEKIDFVISSELLLWTFVGEACNAKLSSSHNN